MIKADIVNIVADHTGLTKLDTKAVIEGAVSVIIDALHRGERIDLRGFGNFDVKLRKSKKARNPGTGEEIVLPDRAVPVFKPSKSLKEQVDFEYKNRENNK